MANSHHDDLAGLFNALVAMVEPDREMPIYRALMLLQVAMNPGMRMTELEEITGFTHAAVSRNMLVLSEWRTVGQAGLNLVEPIDDPVDRNRKLLFLTPKGRKYMEGILAELTGKKVTLEPQTAADHVKRVHAGGAG